MHATQRKQSHKKSQKKQIPDIYIGLLCIWNIKYEWTTKIAAYFAYANRLDRKKTSIWIFRMQNDKNST